MTLVLIVVEYACAVFLLQQIGVISLKRNMCLKTWKCRLGVWFYAN